MVHLLYRLYGVDAPAHIILCLSLASFTLANNNIVSTVRFNGHFFRWTLVSRYENVSITHQPFYWSIIAATRHLFASIEARMMEVVVTTGTIYILAKLHWNHHYQRNNTILFLTCRMPFPLAYPRGGGRSASGPSCRPINSVKALNGRIVSNSAHKRICFLITSAKEVMLCFQFFCMLAENYHKVRLKGARVKSQYRAWLNTKTIETLLFCT